MTRARLTFRQWVGWTGFAMVAVLTLAVAIWRGDILQAWLDPGVPFQTYTPPPAPDYAQADSWALNEARVPQAGDAAVFFLHSTTFDGGRDWNSPINDAGADRYLERVVLPNYAGPFSMAGAISAPRYRQASLYTRLTSREDAREARAFAYRDVAAAFEVWLARHPTEPLVLAGVEQGGELLERLVRDKIADNPEIRRRVVAVYLIDVVTPAQALQPQLPACRSRAQRSCIVGWSPVTDDNDGAASRRLRRALVWDARGQLVSLDGRAALCVNPVTGSTGDTAVSARLHAGATNATGLEWGARPALLAREIATRCEDGVLRHSPPTSESFKPSGSWSDRRKSRPYNLFYGDIERDVQARLRMFADGPAA